MSALRRFLSLASSPMTPLTAVSPERQRLRDALAAQARAKQTLQEAVRASDRVRNLATAAQDAEDAAAAAASAAAQATKTWAASGARAGTAPANQQLLDAAAAARRRADDARITAAGATEGMSAVSESIRLARVELENSAFAIRDAIAGVLLAEAGSQFETLERAHAQYVEALADIKALHAVLRAGGPAHVYFDHRSDGAAAAIAERLSQCAIPSMTDADLRPRAGAWVELARRLAADPDAHA